MRRTLSLPDRRILIGSTPLDAATSTVRRLYQQSDMRVWTIPSPHFREFSEVRWPRSSGRRASGHMSALMLDACQQRDALEQEISRSRHPSERVF